MIQSYYDGTPELTAHNGSPDFTRISPSNASKFFSNTRQWYGELFLNEPGFEGSDSSVLGSIIHYFAELAGKGHRPPADPQSIVDSYLALHPCDDIDEIQSLWKDMSNVLISGCINGHTKPTLVEQFIFHQLLPGIYVAGTLDALIPLGNGTYSVRDYKSSATKPSAIPYNYRMQAHIYAFILTKMGYNISQIELQYVTRPTKTLPSRHFPLIEPFTNDDLLKIESQLLTMAHSIHMWKSHPNLHWLIAQDIRLKQPDKPTLFKD